MQKSDFQRHNYSSSIFREQIVNIRVYLLQPYKLVQCFDNLLQNKPDLFHSVRPISSAELNIGGVKLILQLLGDIPAMRPTPQLYLSIQEWSKTMPVRKHMIHPTWPHDAGQDFQAQLQVFNKIEGGGGGKDVALGPQ